MLQNLGPEGRSLWPCAVQHACWTSRQGAKRRTALVPAFGDIVTTKIKDTPSDGFAPRGRDAKFLGCVDNVTSGVLVGNFDGHDWDLEIVSSYVLHGTVEVDLTQNEEECKSESSSHNAVEAAGDGKAEAPRQVTFAPETYTQEELEREAAGRKRPKRIRKRADVENQHTTDEESQTQDPGSPRRDASKEVGGEVTQSTSPLPPKSKSKGKGKCKVPDYASDDEDDPLPPTPGKSSNGGLASPPEIPKKPTDTVTAKQPRVEAPPTVEA